MKKDIESLLAKIGAQKKWPITTHFDLTYKCNQRCIHCCVVNKDILELTTGEIKRVLKELIHLNCFLLTFSGGEIFLMDDIYDIISTAHKLRYRITILSNGTLVTPKIAQFLKRNNVAKVHVSIYSTNEKIHDAITRIEGSWKRAMEGIKALLKERLKVIIGAPLMSNTFHNYRKIKLLADTLGTGCILGPQIIPRMDFDQSPTALSPTKQQLTKLYLDRSTAKKNFCSIKKHAAEFRLESLLNKTICAAGHNRCYISPYGDVFPCTMLLVNAGNVRYKTLYEIWYDSPILNYVRDMRFRMFKDCIGCHILPYCEPCPGLNFQEKGDVFVASKLHCRLGQAKGAAIKLFLGKEEGK